MTLHAPETPAAAAATAAGTNVILDREETMSRDKLEALQLSRLQHTVASGVDINFLKPAFRGQVLTAVADRRSSAGRSGLYDIQIFAADAGATPDADARPGSLPSSGQPGELIAEFRGRSRTIPKK